jgi:hypothetical protein
VGRDAGTDRDADRALHLRLLSRDPTATSDLVVSYLEPLTAWLRSTFPREDDALLETVATDLLLSVGERPEQYDPDRLSLMSYLHMAARGDVRNARESEHRHTRRHSPLEDVELRPPARNSQWAIASDPADTVLAALDDGDTVLAMRHHFDETEWEVVQMVLDGERRTVEFARVLSLHDLPRAAQVREVKRAKDRLKKRLQRLWRKRPDDD